MLSIAADINNNPTQTKAKFFPPSLFNPAFHTAFSLTRPRHGNALLVIPAKSLPCLSRPK